MTEIAKLLLTQAMDGVRSDEAAPLQIRTNASPDSAKRPGVDNLHPGLL